MAKVEEPKGEDKVLMYIKSKLEDELGYFWRNIKWFKKDMANFCIKNWGYDEDYDSYRKYLYKIRVDMKNNPDKYDFEIIELPNDEVEGLIARGFLKKKVLVLKFKYKEAQLELI